MYDSLINDFIPIRNISCFKLYPLLHNLYGIRSAKVRLSKLLIFKKYRHTIFSLCHVLLIFIDYFKETF